MKILVFIIFSLSLVNADYLLSAKNKCIIDYYYKGGYLYYYYSTTPNTLRSTSYKNYQKGIFSGFTYDPDTKICKKNEYLGLSYEQYNFLYALFGLFLGFLILWLVPKRS